MREARCKWSLRDIQSLSESHTFLKMKFELRFVQCNSSFLPSQSVPSASSVSACAYVYKALMFATHLSTFSFLVCVFVSASCGSALIFDADCWLWWKMLPSGTDCGLLQAGSNDKHNWNNNDRNQEKRRWVMTAWFGDSISWQSELVSHKTDWIFACGASAAWAHVQYAQISSHTDNIHRRHNV